MKNINEYILDTIKSLEKKELVLFCGAGISCNSGFPMVNQLIKCILNKLGVYGKHKEIFLNANLPFEAFVEILRENSIIDNILDIYDADKPRLNSAKPNSNHLLVSRMVKSGRLKTILTTNFDQLIEKALALKPNGMEEGKDYDVFYKEEDFETIDWGKDRIRLIKIHGSIHDKENMAISLKQVASKNVLSPRKRVIDYIFSDGLHKSVLILGYSCSDVFDISPMIESVDNGQKKVFLIQHFNGKPKAENIKLQKYKNPFKKNSGVRIFCNTDILVQTFWHEIFNQSHDLAMSSISWKNNLDSWNIKVESISPANKFYLAGALFYKISEFQIAKTYYEKGSKISQDRGEKWAEGDWVGNLGKIYYSIGEYYKAIEYYEQAIKNAKNLGKKKKEGVWLGTLGVVYRGLGKFHEAIECYKQALKIAREMRDNQAEGGLLGNLGSVYFSMEDQPKAIGYYKQALKIARAIGDKQTEGGFFGNLGNAYRSNGEYKKAIKCHEHALKIAQNLGSKQAEGFSLGNLGNDYRCIEEYPKAIKYYEKSLEISLKIGDKWGEGNGLGNMGIICQKLGETDKAIINYERALLILRLVLGNEHPLIKLYENNLAEVIRNQREKRVTPIFAKN